jgi:2-amino-4-hydroxy-6-hydroxymethyldihydropteridine diphosphokinase
MIISYIGLGSNLDEPLVQIQTALTALQEHAQIELLSYSSFYQSKALTMPDSEPQDDYINAVAKLATDLSPEQLLQQLNHIEALQGRERHEKWGARTLDLDILLYDELQIQTDELVIPHAQIKFRNFVIHPLFEVAGAISLPGLGELAQLAQQTDWDGLQRIDENN